MKMTSTVDLPLYQLIQRILNIVVIYFDALKGKGTISIWLVKIIPTHSKNYVVNITSVSYSTVCVFYDSKVWCIFIKGYWRWCYFGVLCLIRILRCSTEWIHCTWGSRIQFICFSYRIVFFLIKNLYTYIRLCTMWGKL